MDRMMSAIKPPLFVVEIKVRPKKRPIKITRDPSWYRG